jgi:hypothetical protein
MVAPICSITRNRLRNQDRHTEFALPLRVISREHTFPCEYP